MKRNANAAAEVTIMVRLRFVSKYRGMNCAKKFICYFIFEEQKYEILRIILHSRIEKNQ